MSDLVIRVSSLGKRYRVGSRGADSLRERLTQIATTPIRFFARPEPAEEFWALRDVSFDVRRGEIIGIIGSNGAGKSTLLKTLSRITEPTTGFIDIAGRIASLLEVGTGFHPELTGRENIFLNGTILGMRRAEIRRKFDEIVAFAEVERFIDTAVKHYSSGMYLRLAFAVAAHLESEILIVDEVLAVGDAAFQRKCLGKMEETSQQGRTILFVSHNLAAVNQLCQRALCLSHGRVVDEGPSYDVVARYLSSGDRQGPERTWSFPGDAPGDDRVRLLAARVRSAGETSGVIDVNQMTLVEMDVLVRTAVNNLVPSFGLSDAHGTLLFRSCDWKPNRLQPGLYRFVAEVPAQTMAEGRVTVLLQNLFFDPFAMCFSESDALAFEAVDSSHPNAVRGPYLGPWPGVLRLGIAWRPPTRIAAPVEAAMEANAV